MTDRDLSHFLKEARERSKLDDDFDLDAMLRGGQRRARHRRVLQATITAGAAAVVVVTALILAPHAFERQSVNTVPASPRQRATQSFALTTHDPGKFVPQALVSSGVVRATEDGCPYVELQETRDIPLLWPPGWTARREAGMWVYADPTGNITIQEGDKPHFVGGFGRDTRDPCRLIGGAAFKIYTARSD